MSPSDYLDEVAETQEREVNAVLQLNSARLRDMSLQTRVEMCKVCGKKISKARQKALPGVQTCIKCATEQEAS